MEYLKTLNNIFKGMEDEAGIRAVNLSVLDKKGFDIPLSFVLTNNAFEDFILANDLQLKIGAVLSAPLKPGETYQAVRELMLNGKFPEKMIKELYEAYESLVVDKESDLNDLLKDDDPFVTLVISPNYPLDPENREGVIINVHDFEDLLDAVRECWATLFTPHNLAHRRKLGFGEQNLNTGIIIHNMKYCDVSFEAYSATGEDIDLIRVNTYFGFPDLSGTVEKDEFKLNREYLKIEYQAIGFQTFRLARDLDGKLDKVMIGELGEEQKLNDKYVMEIGRLAKKASNLLKKQVKITGYVINNKVRIYICDELPLSGENITPIIDEDEVVEEEIPNEEPIIDDDSATTVEEPVEEAAEPIITEPVNDLVAEPAVIDDEPSGVLLNKEVIEDKEAVLEDEGGVVEEKEELVDEADEDDDFLIPIPEPEDEDQEEESVVEEADKIIDDEESIFDNINEINDLKTEPIDQEREGIGSAGESSKTEETEETEDIEEIEETGEIRATQEIEESTERGDEKEVEEVGGVEEIEEVEEVREVGERVEEREEMEEIEGAEAVDEEDGEETRDDETTEDNEHDESDDEDDDEDDDADENDDEEIEEFEEEDDEEFYNAYELVKEALLRKYEERFRKLAPDVVTDLYIELSNEIIMPYEEKISKLIKIFEQEEPYTDDEKEELIIIAKKFYEEL